MAESGSGAPAPRLIVMRHGERADATKDYGWKDPEFPYDPPLTPRGHEHAKTAAAIIRSKFPSLLGIRVLCSPFLRCLQTATHVADSLEQASIEVVPQFADILSEYGFIYSDVRWRWVERQIDASHQVDPNRFTQAPDSLYPKYKESMEGAAERLRGGFSQLRARYPSDHLILISHWYSLEAAAGMKDRSLPSFEAGYCAMLEIDTSSWNVVSFSPHLESAKSK